MPDRNKYYAIQRRDFRRGQDAHRMGQPYSRYETAQWRRGWLSEVRAYNKPPDLPEADDPVMPAVLQPASVIDNGRLEMMRRGGGNRSGTSGGKGR